MSDGPRDDDAGGCIGCAAALVALALVVAALISLAALIDPFSWMPPVGDIWADCEDDYGTDRDECALENRFPGFWIHAIVNLVYAALSLALMLSYLVSVAELREKRAARFANAAAWAEHSSAARLTLALGTTLSALALLPIVVAVA